MEKNNIKRLKKYLFFISVFFSLLIISHLSYLYLYEDSKEVPIEGWSLSEGIIWDFPHLNPIIHSTNYNKYIISLLYRSLLKYDSNTQKIESDLANCDIKNLLYIECYLKENIYWSDWKELSIKDVISTYNLIKNSDVNEILREQLKNTTIEERNNIIIFSNKSKDISFLNVLFQPILSKNTLDNIGNNQLYGKFPTYDWVYSGRYKLDIRSYDDTLWIDKLILIKNEFYKEKNSLISKLIFKFFKNEYHFLKHKDTVNSFLDTNKIVWDALSRMDSYKFTLPQYTSLFINISEIPDLHLRSFILDKVNRWNIVKNLWESYKEVLNPYMTDKIIDKTPENNNIVWIMKDLSYYKKTDLIEIHVKDNILNETSSWWEIKSNVENNLEKTLTYIKKPISNKLSYLWEDNLLIEWNVLSEKPKNIYINDYKLKSYKLWDKSFFYRLRKDFNNIVSWDNNYKVYFDYGTWKTLVEDFHIVFNKNKEQLEKSKNDYISKLEEEKLKEKELLEKDFEEKAKEKEEISLSEELKSLNNHYFYTKDFELFSLDLIYLDSQKENIEIAENIKNSLEIYGIPVNIDSISISWLKEKILNWEKDYDLLLAWTDFWIFNYNIIHYFHSSQVKKWYNFSNIKKFSLDLILEELKSNILSNEKIKELEEEVLSILKSEQIIKTLYTPYNYYLVDKNIKNFSMNSYLADLNMRFDWFVDSYIAKNNIINKENKSFNGFLKYLLSIFR